MHIPNWFRLWTRTKQNSGTHLGESWDFTWFLCIGQSLSIQINPILGPHEVAGVSTDIPIDNSLTQN